MKPVIADCIRSARLIAELQSNKKDGHAVNRTAKHGIQYTGTVDAGPTEGFTALQAPRRSTSFNGLGRLPCPPVGFNHCVASGRKGWAGRVRGTRRFDAASTEHSAMIDSVMADLGARML